MCGIAVHAVLGRCNGGKEVVDESLERLHHRGPDGHDVLVVPKDELLGQSVVLGHTRLEIVGNDAAKQPLKWSNGSLNFYLVHNGEAFRVPYTYYFPRSLYSYVGWVFLYICRHTIGEIYNYKRLRDQLIGEGDCMKDDFTTDGDSEVLLACLACRGIVWTLHNIRGMFAFVLVETRVNGGREHISNIILCRDAFGIKPLCYAFDGPREKLFICSELLAMPRNIGLKDPRDVLPSTFIEVSFQLKNSQHTWLFSEHRYGNLEAIKSLYTKKCFPGQMSTIRSELIDAVSARIPDGVRMAVLLSGGLDSALVCRLAADLVYPEKLHAFTITTSSDFADENARVTECSLLDSDCHFARIVAKEAFNIVHEIVEFSFQDGLAILPNVVKCMESADVAMIRAGVPLYILSKQIHAKGFKVVLCGEGADECLAGYRLFEDYSVSGSDLFLQELWRRTINIDTSELQRVDRCTSAHGLEARVPFMDVGYVKAVMGINPEEKMTHPALGRIQKYALRKAFDGKNYHSALTGKQLLPDSVLYREKEQFADGVGRGWIAKLQKYAAELFPGHSLEEAECTLYESYQGLGHPGLENLIRHRNERRQHTRDGMVARPGRPQPARWYPVRSDPDLCELNLSKEDALRFLQRVLGWSRDDVRNFSPNLPNLNKLISSMLERVPFHNLTLLTRERRPPTMAEIREDMMSGIGGPCSVINSFFAVILDRMGFGPHVYLLSCEINHRNDCHVAVMLQLKGLRYFVDVANAKPYNQAVHLGNSSSFTGLDGSFQWGLRYNEESGLMEVHHSDEKAISFHPASTVPYASFRAMIARSRSDASFGPFLTGLRICLYPDEASRILAVRDACVYEGGSTRTKYCATGKEEIRSIAKQPPLGLIVGFEELLDEAICVLDREKPGWFERSREFLREKEVSKHSVQRK